MNHLHKEGYAHSDFKADNIVVEIMPRSIRLKGIDFASMTSLDGLEAKPTVGTLSYMSLGRCLDRDGEWSLVKDDRFALGVTIFVIAYSEYPFGHD